MREREPGKGAGVLREREQKERGSVKKTSTSSFLSHFPFSFLSLCLSLICFAFSSVAASRGHLFCLLPFYTYTCFFFSSRLPYGSRSRWLRKRRW